MRIVTLARAIVLSIVCSSASAQNGRTVVELDRFVPGAEGSTTAIGSFSNDGVGKNIRIFLKAHNGGVIDVHTYELSEVCYIGARTGWLELPLSQSSASYSGQAGYAIDAFRPNIESWTDAVFLRIRVKRTGGVGSGNVQVVLDYDDDVAFLPSVLSSSAANGFNASTAPAGGPVGGYLGNLEWSFPVSGGQGWNTAGGLGVFIRNSGDVGIGTSLPGGKLGIADSNQVLNVLMNKRLAGTWPPVAEANTVTLQSSGAHAGSLAFAVGNSEYMRLSSDGNVGIGTSAPTTVLQIRGTRSYGSLRLSPSSDGGESALAFFRDATGNAVNDAWVVGQGCWGNHQKFVIGLQTSGGPVITADSNGSVGIGTTNPTHKLSVSGTIKAKEVIVETTGWSDYVLAEDYRLAPLSEVEAHIKAEKRLPGIPSEQQVSEQGVSVGEMQAALLAKIEELTLHQIRQEKRLDAQQEEIRRLRAENAELRRLPNQL